MKHQLSGSANVLRRPVKLTAQRRPLVDFHSGGKTGLDTFICEGQLAPP